MNDNDIIFSLYFSDTLKIETINSLISYVSSKSQEVYKKEIEEISYSYQKDGKQKNKSLKLNSRNLEKFNREIHEGVLKSFEVFNLSDNWSFKARDTDISFCYVAKNAFVKQCSILLQMYEPIGSERLTIYGIKAINNDLIKFLLKQGVEIQYGFVFPMERHKLPKFFASGIKSERLSEDEAHQAFVWNNKKHLCKEKIWDIFWGNILTTKHLDKGQLLAEITALVGSENVLSVDNDIFICYLPVKIMEIEENNLCRDKLKTIFTSYDKLIK